MGQKAGKAAYADAARPFLNLSPTALAALWDSFNDVADGFGLSSREVQQICAILQDELQLPRCKLDEKASGLMDLLDVDCNGLVDAIEMMSALAVCSGLSPADTVAFIFNCYDFDGSGMHTVDEVALAVKSTAIGVCKLANEPLPTDAEVDNLSLIIFEGAAEGDSEVLSAEHAELARVSSTRLRDQILEQPELFSWINFFDEPAEPDMDPLLPLAHEVDYEAECRPPGGGLEEAEAQAYETFPFPPKSDLVKQERELPWKSAIKSLVPSEWGSRVPPGDAPKHHLHMRWVYGYSSITSKNNARYNADGEVIYAAGRVGVAYSLSEHRQTHFLGHTGDIRCLAMHPDGVLVATGEVAASAGAKASIAIWDSRTGELIRVIRGVHDGGVIQLAFSPDGRLLASVGLDAHHSLAVYDWEACPTGRLVATAAGTNARVFACCFAGTRGRSIVVCSEESATFWRLERGGIVGVRGIFGRKARQQPLLACVALVGGGNGDHVVTGCASGHIYLWRDRNCVAAVKAHRGSAGALAPCAGGGFVSGGIDMRVRMWTKRLEPGASFDLSAFGPHSGIRSVCTSADGSRLLVGLASSGLYEISSADGSDLRGGAIAGSHAAGRVMGLAVHPSEPCFVTVGDDGVVRVWDAKRRIALRMTQLDSPTRCVEYSPDGSLLVVGLGDGRNLTSKEGAFLIMRSKDFGVLYEARDSTTCITDVRWSPDGETLALGAGDGTVYLYATHELCHPVNSHEELPAAANPHVAEDAPPVQLAASIRDRFHGPVLAMDFSADGEWLRIAGADEYLGFFDAVKGDIQTGLAAFRDVKWATETCPYSWNVAGASNEALLAGATLQCTDTSRNGYMMVMGDSFGRLRLFRSPTSEAIKCASYHELRGHESPGIARARFLVNDTALISCGGADGCIFQWATLDEEVEAEKAHGEEDAAPLLKEESPEVSSLHFDDDQDLKRQFAAEMVQDPFMRHEKVQEDGASADAAQPPWKEVSIPPSFPPETDPSPPDDGLYLEAVHGYSGHGRCNAAYLSGGSQVVFVAASTAVNLNTTTGNQLVQSGHSAPILCMALAPDGKVAATGQEGSSGRILLWETNTCRLLRELRGVHHTAVSALAFSCNGNLLASAGCDDAHSIIIRDWRTGFVIAAAPSGPGRVNHMSWGVGFQERSALVTASLLVDEQQDHLPLGLWDIGSGDGSGSRNLARRSAFIGSKGRRQSCYSCIFVAGGGSAQTALVGTADGHIYAFFDGAKHLGRALKAHTGAVQAMSSADEGQMLISGGQDGFVKVFGSAPAFDLLAEVSPSASAASSNSVRSVSMSLEKGVVLVGLWGGNLLELPVPLPRQEKSAYIKSPRHLCGGHSTGGVWDIAVHPRLGDEFASVGDDGLLRLWKCSSTSPVRELKLDTSLRAVAYSPDGRRIALGCGGHTAKRGTLFVLDSVTLAVLHEGKDAGDYIRCLAYSPDGRRLASASHDLRIYIYTCDPESGLITLLSAADAHLAPPSSVDFTPDGAYLMSSDEAGVLLWTDSGSGLPVSNASSVRDLQWTTWSSPVGWPVLGLQEPRNQGVERVDRSKNGSLLAAGDMHGQVRLLRWPASEVRAGSLTFRGHAGRISAVRWSNGDEFLLTAGRDGSIIRWRRVKQSKEVDSGDEAEESGDEEVAPPGKTLDQLLCPLPSPWSAAMLPPSRVLPPSNSAPPIQLLLETAHGCNTLGARGCVRYTRGGEALFPSGTLCVSVNPSTGKQVFHTGHGGRVTALTVTPDGRVAASGSEGLSPTLDLWDCGTGALLQALPPHHVAGVAVVAFSPDGQWLASLGRDLDNTVTVYYSSSGQWWDVVRIASAPSGRRLPHFMLFTGKNGFPLMVGGQKFIWSFHHIPGGSDLRRIRCNFGTGPGHLIQSIMCGVRMRGDGGAALTGTASGHLYVWRDERLQRSIDAHCGAVMAVCSVGSGYASAGRDGLIRLWDSQVAPVKQLASALWSPAPVMPALQSVWPAASGAKLLVSTQGGELYEVAVESGTAAQVANSHSSGQLQGLAADPSNADCYVTTGEDAMLQVWSRQRKRWMHRTRLDAGSRAVTFSHDGSFIAIGLGGGPGPRPKDGCIQVLRATTLEVEQEVRPSKDSIADLSYSPDGSQLAVATEKGEVFVLDVANDLRTLSTIRARSAIEIESVGHMPAITAIDWSVDGTILRLATDDHDMVHALAAEGTVVASKAQVKDVVFATHATPVGWNARGIYGSTGTSASACLTTAVSQGGDLLAAGYADGRVLVLRYPAVIPDAPSLVIRGHASPVVKVVWTADDSALLSVSSDGRLILEHAVVRPASAAPAQLQDGDEDIDQPHTASAGG